LSFSPPTKIANDFKSNASANQANSNGDDKILKMQILKKSVRRVPCQVALHTLEVLGKRQTLPMNHAVAKFVICGPAFLFIENKTDGCRRAKSIGANAV
jgi:hypothetical protein